MKLTYQKRKEYRPNPYPCWIVYEKIVTYFLGIPLKSKLKKIK